jgi:hypothetical protein
VLIGSLPPAFSGDRYDKLVKMPTASKGRHETLVIVVSVAVVAGMAVASLLLLLWKVQPSFVTAGAGMRLAIGLCPPFMLVPIIGEAEESVLGHIIIGGAVVIGNGSLYAGFAAFAYWLVATFLPKR